jgi:hypothetical protein
MQKLVLSSILAPTLAFVLGFNALAQQQTKIPRIGFLTNNSSLVSLPPTRLFDRDCVRLDTWRAKVS